MKTTIGTARAPAFKRAESLPEAIANHIAQSVASRRLTDGTRIVETALAAELGVSRVPVREALKILATQGIIDGGGHRGYRVAGLSEKVIESVQEARMATESLFLRDAIANWRAGLGDITVLDERIAAMRRAARDNDVPEMLRADVAFHTAVCDAAQNPIFTMLWTAIARHVLIILNLARFRDVDLEVVVRRHEVLRDQIVDAVKGKQSPAKVRPILEKHFLAARHEHSPVPLGPGRPAPAKRRGSRAAAPGDAPQPAGAGGDDGAISPKASRRRPSGKSPS